MDDGLQLGGSDKKGHFQVMKFIMNSVYEFYKDLLNRFLNLVVLYFKSTIVHPFFSKYPCYSYFRNNGKVVSALYHRLLIW